MKRQKEMQKLYFDNFFKKNPEIIFHHYDEEGNLYLCNGYWLHKIWKHYKVIDPIMRENNLASLMQHDLNDYSVMKKAGYTPDNTLVIMESNDGIKEYYNKKYYEQFEKADGTITFYRKNGTRYSAAVIYQSGEFIGLLMPCRYEGK